MDQYPNSANKSDENHTTSISTTIKASKGEKVHFLFILREQLWERLYILIKTTQII